MVYKLSSMILAAVAAIGLGATAHAGVLLVAGSPGYDPATQTGLKDGEMSVAPGSGVNNSGTAVGSSTSYVSGSSLGLRAVRWDASGAAATELGNLGTNSSGSTTAVAYAVNAVGTTAGYSEKYDLGSSLGLRAVRWAASGTAATELGYLGTDSLGYTDAVALAVNDAGTVVGRSNKYDSNVLKGTRAVRWDASGTIATELGNLGTRASGGITSAEAYAVNTAGTAVGAALVWVVNASKGFRAVRWAASGTAATELGNLGLTNGVTEARALAINDAGTAVGYAQQPGTVSHLGNRAVRWAASGTTATELDHLGLRSDNFTDARTYAVNAAGTAVGYSQKYDLNGNLKGFRAVRWDASGIAATELDTLGTDGNGVTTTYAYAVNDAGTAVGYAQKYDLGGSYVGDRAVIWLPNAGAIDLNDLGVAPVPAGGTWTLTTARALSTDGWVAGSGTFDPDGAEPLAGYVRHWVAQVGLGGTWTNAAGGTWGRGPNWSTGTPAMQVGNAAFNLDSVYAVALDRNELTQTIAINAGTVTIDFNGHTLATESGLSIAGGATLKGDGTIVSDISNAGTLELAPSSTLSYAGKITGGGKLTKSGGGTVILSGANDYTGLTTVKAGTLQLGVSAQDPVLTGANGADIQGGKIVLEYAGSAPDVLTPLAYSYHAGAWDRGQFKNTTADASHGLGWADNGVDQVKVAYTFYGDATLDGSVNADDLAKVLANYNQLSGMVWSQGDFDYNATVDATDLAKVLANYNQGPIVPGINATGSDAQAIQMLTAAGFTVVPEPGTLPLLAAGLAALAGWMTRRWQPNGGFCRKRLPLIGRTRGAPLAVGNRTNDVAKRLNVSEGVAAEVRKRSRRGYGVSTTTRNPSMFVRVAGDSLRRTAERQ